MTKDYTLPESHKWRIVFADADMQADYEHNRELGANHNDAVMATNINFGNYPVSYPQWIEYPRKFN